MQEDCDSSSSSLSDSPPPPLACPNELPPLACPNELPPLACPNFANEEKDTIEEIHLDHCVVNGREYNQYTSGSQFLNIVRFKIGVQKFISINSNVLPFNAFIKLRQISPLHAQNDVLSVILTFDTRTIVLHNCNVNLCIRAFSELK